MPGWYSRPVVAVTDFDRASSFYLESFGFKEDWRHFEGDARIMQVSREGCELILSNQWPERAGTARFFVSLDWPEYRIMRDETAAKGIATEGQWGYHLIVVADPDGNELWFPHPGPEGEEAAG